MLQSSYTSQHYRRNKMFDTENEYCSYCDNQIEASEPSTRIGGDSFHDDCYQQYGLELDDNFSADELSFILDN